MRDPLPTIRPFHRAPRRWERGFTMIELIVVMVLLMIVGAVVSRALTNAFKGSADAVSTQNTEHLVGQALDQLRSDLIKAGAPDRTPSNVREVSELRAALVNGETIYSANPAGPTGPLDIRDIVLATPNALSVRADVDAQAGVECVHYQVEGASPGWRLTRQIRQVNCSTPLRPVTEVLPPQTVNPITFRYMLVCSGAGCGGSCAPQMTSNAPLPSANWIVSVGFDVTGRTTRLEGIQHRVNSEFATVRSRESDEYRRALGC